MSALFENLREILDIAGKESQVTTCSKISKSYRFRCLNIWDNDGGMFLVNYEEINVIKGKKTNCVPVVKSSVITLTDSLTAR